MGEDEDDHEDEDGDVDEDGHVYCGASAMPRKTVTALGTAGTSVVMLAAVGVVPLSTKRMIALGAGLADAVVASSTALLPTA